MRKQESQPTCRDQRASKTSLASPRNIVVLGLTYPLRGGISHYSTLLVRELRKKHRVRFISIKRQFPKVFFPGRTELDKSHLRLEELNEDVIDCLSPLSWLKATRLILSEPVDLVLVQSWNTFVDLVFGIIVNGLRRSNPGVNIAAVMHNVRRHEPHWADTAVFGLAFRNIDQFLAHSEVDAARLLELKPGARVVRYAHPEYGCFRQFGRPSSCVAKQSLGFAPDSRVILFFGIVRKYKGLRHLIEAFAIVREEIDCVLVIAGEFYEPRDQYMDLIKRLGLDEWVMVVDRYIPNEEVPRYFCGADVVALPYVQATQSGVFQIARAFGRNVVASDAGGLSEMVLGLERCVSFPAGDTPALAEAIVSVLRRETSSADEWNPEEAGDSEDDSWTAAVTRVEEFL